MFVPVGGGEGLARPAGLRDGEGVVALHSGLLTRNSRLCSGWLACTRSSRGSRDQGLRQGKGLGNLSPEHMGAE